MIKKFINYYQTQDAFAFWSTSLSLLIALAIMAVWAVNYPNLPSKLPLFYSLPWGEGQLSNLSQFIILPSVILLVIFINLIISWHLHSSQFLLKRMLSISSIVIAVLILITALKIIYTFI